MNPDVINRRAVGRSRALIPGVALALLVVGCQSQVGVSTTAGTESTHLDPPAAELVGEPNATVSVPTGPGVIRLTDGDDLTARLAGSPEGSTFVFSPGTYREITIEPRDGDRFVGEEGAILNGARLLDRFEREGDLWVASGQSQEGETRGECESGYQACIFPEQLFIDDQPLWQVSARDDVQPGKWFFDYESDRIYFADDPRDRRVETSVARFAFYGSANDVVIQNLTIEKYANPAQFGAIHGVADPGPLSSGWTVEGNRIRYNHGSGIRLGRTMTVRGNVVHHNGHIGINGTGRDILIEGNEIAYNQTGGFLAFGWVGGGAKFIDTEGLRVIGNYVHHNNGHGLHTDHNNIDTLYQDNLIEYNTGTGINHEISYDAVIVDNEINANGFGRARDVLGAGIMVNTSSNVTVADNELRGNADGIIGQHTDRGNGELGRWELRNLRVESNFVELEGGSHGVVARLDQNLVFSEWNNGFTTNMYRFGPGTELLWNGRRLDFAGWQGLGQDIEGDFEDLPDA